MPTFDLMVHAQVCFAVDVRNAQNLEDAEKVMNELLVNFNKGREGYVIDQRDCDEIVSNVFGPDTSVMIDDARIWIEGESGPIVVNYDDEVE